jgi:hypothetical protein
MMFMRQRIASPSTNVAAIASLRRLVVSLRTHPANSRDVSRADQTSIFLVQVENSYSILI